MIQGLTLEQAYCPTVSDGDIVYSTDGIGGVFTSLMLPQAEIRRDPVRGLQFITALSGTIAWQYSQARDRVGFVTDFQNVYLEKLIEARKEAGVDVSFMALFGFTNNEGQSWNLFACPGVGIHTRMANPAVEDQYTQVNPGIGVLFSRVFKGQSTGLQHRHLQTNPGDVHVITVSEPKQSDRTQDFVRNRIVQANATSTGEKVQSLATHLRNNQTSNQGIHVTVVGR
jgi:hypothetical protein